MKQDPNKRIRPGNAPAPDHDDRAPSGAGSGAPSGTEDEGIVALLFDRSEKGLEQAAARYGRLCRSIARNLLRSDEDADEVLDDVWLALWDTVPPARPASLTAYLGALTRRISIDRLRRKTAARRQAAGGTLLLDELAECLPDGSESDPLDRVHLTDTLNAFLDGLGETDRTIMIRRYWYCDPTARIADDLGMTDTAVRVRLHRLRGALKKRLEEAGIAVP